MSADNNKDATSRTGLYTAVKNHDWDLVASRLKTHPEEASIVVNNNYDSPTCLHEAAMYDDIPIQLLEQLIDAFPEALSIPGCYDNAPPCVFAIKECVAMPKIKLLLERCPDVLKIELAPGYGFPITRIWHNGRPREDARTEEWNEWKAMMKFALDYYPEATIQQVDNGHGDTLIEWILSSSAEHQGPIGFEVTQMVFDAAYQCLIKSKRNGELPLDYQYLPIHAAIELLHDKNYTVMDRFCAMQFKPKLEESRAFIRELKCCIYNDEQTEYWDGWERCGGIMKDWYKMNYRMARYGFVEKMIETYPDQVVCRDYQGKLPLELCEHLLNQESEFGYSSQSPQVHISRLIREQMSRMSSDLVFEKFGVRPASLTFGATLPARKRVRKSLQYPSAIPEKE